MHSRLAILSLFRLNCIPQITAPLPPLSHLYFYINNEISFSEIGPVIGSA
jgi:hypothetical protein